MRKYLLLYFLILVNLLTYSQDIYWTNDSLKTDNYLYPSCSVTDNENIYVGGVFKNKILNFDQSQTIFDNLGVSDLDVYIAKYSAEGEIENIVRVGSTDNDYIKDIAIRDGYVYAVGIFKSDLTDGVGGTISCTGSYDGFIIKYDLNLNIVWAKNVVFGSGNTLQTLTDIDFNINGDLIVSGQFKNEIIFNNSTGNDTLKSTYKKTTFIAKFDVNGNYISSVQFDCTNNANIVNDISSKNDNIYLTIRFKDKLFFYSDSLDSKGDNDGVVMKIDNNLNFQWIRRIQGSSYDNVFTINTDNNENLYISGYYKSSDLVIDSTKTEVSTVTPINNGDFDWIFMSYSSEGNLRWLKFSGSSGADAVFNSSFANDNFFVSGYYSNELIYDKDTLKNLYNSKDAAYLIINPNTGELNMYESIVGSGTELGLTISNYEDNLNTTYIRTGIFTSDTIFIGNDTIINSDVDNNKTDMFLIKNDCNSQIHPKFDIDSITCPTGNDGKISVFMTINGTDTVDNNWSYKWSNGATADSTYDLSESWYKLRATSQKGCSYLDSTYLTHRRALETFLKDTVTLLCAKDTLDTAIVTPSYGVPPYHYAWSNGSSDSITTKLVVGLYDVTVTDFCGMSSRVVDTIKIGHIPTMNPSLNAYNIVIACQDGKDGNAWVDTTDGVSPYSFKWENSNSTQYKALDLGVGLHHVTITDQCKTVIDSVNVISLPPLQVRIEDKLDISCTGDSTGSAVAIAYGGVSPLSYKWTSLKDSTRNATHLAEGVNWVTVTDVCGSVKDSVKISVKPALKVTYTLNNPSCYGDANGSVELNIEDGVKPYTIHWSNTEVSSTLLNLKEGAYTYTVTDACGDKNKQIGVVAISNPDSITIKDSLVAETATGENNGAVYLNVSGGTSPFVYSWSNNETYQNIENIAGGTYTVTVTDKNNCTVTKIYTVETTKKSIEIYNTFTPNSDGVNDKWNIKNIDQFPNCTVSIFDQWGVKVFESTGYTESWDGTNNGKELPSAVYYYIIDLKDGSRVFRGSVTVIR